MDNPLEKRLNELALRSMHTGRICATRFLEPSMLGAVNAAAAGAGVRVAFWGGYEGAERCVAAFYAGDPPEAGDWPVVALRLQWNAKFANPGHRDLLGAMMGLGIERQLLGDILVEDQVFHVIAEDRIADFLLQEFKRARRIRSGPSFELTKD